MYESNNIRNKKNWLDFNFAINNIKESIKIDNEKRIENYIKHREQYYKNEPA
jgi:hypothetical protein